MRATGSTRFTRLVSAAIVMWFGTALVFGHSGPPYPIVSNHVAGRYVVSVWSDPDSTSDGEPGGRFWVVLARADDKGVVPHETRSTVAVRPLDRPGSVRSGRAEPVEGRVERQFVALLLDHEGPFSVHVRIEGPLGTAEVEATFEATDDLRPAPWLVAVYAFPFVAVGWLWLHALRRRWRAAEAGRSRPTGRVGSRRADPFTRGSSADDGRR